MNYGELGELWYHCARPVWCGVIAGCFNSVVCFVTTLARPVAAWVLQDVVRFDFEERHDVNWAISLDLPSH